MIIVTIYRLTSAGKEALGSLSWQDGRIVTSGGADLDRFVEEIKSGRYRVIIKDRLYHWCEGEAFLRALYLTFQGTYSWAELTET